MAWDVYNDMHMGNTGEVVSEEYSITREGMDAFAAQSQQRAATAQAEGWFAWETVPVQVPQRRGGPVTVLADEGVRADTNAEGLARLRPVFDREGKVTAGNASTLNDGAAAVLVADADLAAEMGWEIIAEIVDQTTSGVAPERVMAAPIPAVRTLLERQGTRRLGRRRVRTQRSLRGRFCAVAQDLGIPNDRFNLHGGAVSLGHPLGASGARCLITMIGAMRRIDAKSGIVTLCLGGGNAVAMLVRRP